MDTLKIFHKSLFVQITCLTGIAFVVHAIVLKFIFPGYYSPLYPHHSDFYIPVALANSPSDFFQYRYLGYSRPVAIFFIKIIGFLGIHGTIMFTVFNVMLNCAISAALFRRLLNIKAKVFFILLFCVYCYLLFSQPYFYTFYTHDVLSHLSYLFLITGTFLFCKLYKLKFKKALLLLFLFSIVSFLCKETYMLVALFCAFLFFIYYRKAGWFKFALLPFLVVSAAIVIVVIFNIGIRSIFINFQTIPGDPYYIQLKPASILKEIVLYAQEAFSFLHVFIIAGMALFLGIFFRHKQRLAVFIIVSCFFGLILSWIPNSVLPNHHNGGYSFNGMYMFYLPLLAFPLQKQKVFLGRMAVLLVLAACILSSLANKREYDKQWWVLEQEKIQRNLLNSLGTLLNSQKSQNEQHRVLITGLTMPFYPFHHPRVLKEYANSRLLTYDVVIYGPSAIKDEREDSVRFIKVADVLLNEYTEVWMFAGDGTLVTVISLNQKTKEVIRTNDYQDMILHPDKKNKTALNSALKTQG